MKRISALILFVLSAIMLNGAEKMFSFQNNTTRRNYLTNHYPNNNSAHQSIRYVDSTQPPVEESNTPNRNQSTEERERQIFGNAANSIDINETAEARKLREKLRDIVRQMNDTNTARNQHQANTTPPVAVPPAANQASNTPAANNQTNQAAPANSAPVQPAANAASQEPTEAESVPTYETPFNKDNNSIKPVENVVIQLFIQYYTTIGRKYLERSFENMQKYYPVIAKKLQENNLPIEFAILPIIESSYNEYARSSSGALGLWQLMPFTAKINGCKINEFVDERMEILKATDAAIKFLLHLKATFNNWDLILAAYNGGGNYLLQQMRKYRSDNFWEFSKKDGFSQQTMEYVPRFYAVYHIMLNLKKYNFKPMDFKKKNYFESVEVARGAGIERIAAILDLQPYELKELNPQLLQNVIPHETGTYSLKVPNGFAKIYLARKQLIQPQVQPAVAVQYVHQKIIVRHGDTINTIAHRYRVNKTDITRLNYLRDPNRLVVGMPLLLPIKVRVSSTTQNAQSADAAPSPRITPARRVIPTRTRQHAPVIDNRLRRAAVASRARRNYHYRRTHASAPRATYTHRRQRLLLMMQAPRKSSIAYKVRRGDTIHRIAKILNITMGKVIAANNGSTHLISGRVLKIYR